MTINNLFVTYDDDGTKHFHINNEEVTEDVWTQQHPHLKRGKDSGGNIATTADSGLVSVGDNGVEADSEAESVRAGIRSERDKAKAERAGSPNDSVGQRQERSEPA